MQTHILTDRQVEKLRVGGADGDRQRMEGLHKWISPLAGHTGKWISPRPSLAVGDGHGICRIPGPIWLSSRNKPKLSMPSSVDQKR